MDSAHCSYSQKYQTCLIQLAKLEIFPYCIINTTTEWYGDGISIVTTLFNLNTGAMKLMLS